MAIRFPIYMDHAATTPCDPRVVEAMVPYFTTVFGNPGSRNHRFGWEAEKTKHVGDGDAASPDPPRDFFLGQSEFSDELFVSLGLFNRIKIFALQILDQGNFQRGVEGGFPHNSRQSQKTGPLSGSPASFMPATAICTR